MEHYWFLLIPFGAIIIGVFFNFILDNPKKFIDLIEEELKKNKIELTEIKCPPPFKVGPFKKVEILVGEPKINDGNIRYKKTYYRVAKLKTTNNKIKKVWIKIETNWFKETKIEFKPELSKL